MSLATYTDLTNAVADWLSRAGDTTLIGRIPDFVTLCEARIAYGSSGAQYSSQPLRTRGMETAVPLATVANLDTVGLPTGYLAVRSIKVLASPNVTLDYVTPTQYDFEFNDSANIGQPRKYTIEGENFRLGPVPDSVYSIRVLYYQKLPSLLSNATNWLMTNAPSVYLYGTLLEAAIYLRDDDLGQQMVQFYLAAINSLQAQDETDRHSGASLVMRSDSFNP